MSSKEYSHDQKHDSHDAKQQKRHDADTGSVLGANYPVWAEDTENNPRLWSKGKKWGMVFLVSFYTFVRCGNLQIVKRDSDGAVSLVLIAH